MKANLHTPWSDEIELLSFADNQDADGYGVEPAVRRQVFCNWFEGVSQNEFYQAQALGLKPEIKFIIADFADYGGQKQLKYKPFGGTEQVYDVLRTFRNKINLEIVCKRGVDK